MKRKNLFILQLFFTITCFGQSYVSTNIQVEYPTCTDDESSVFISIGSSFYPSEMTWDITNDSTGEVEFSGFGDNFDNEFPICLEAGSYTFNSIDSYGDG